MSAKYQEDEVTVRDAKREDMAAVAGMIQELADFEKMSDGPQLTVEDLERDGYDSQPPAFLCKVAELTSPASDEDPTLGYAIYFPTYSTWEGRALMLEDLYVKPAARGRGVGTRLLNSIAQEARARASSRVDLHVLEWNPARAFYARAGAADLARAPGWRLLRLAGAALAAAAASHVAVHAVA